VNSEIYFLGGTFPSGIKCLTQAYSNKEEYVKKRAVLVSHFDKQKKKINHVSDSNVRNVITKWLENRKYTRQELLSVIRDKYWSCYKVSVDMLAFGVPKQLYRSRVRAGDMWLDVEVAIPHVIPD
jgi:hypothetical protein